MWVSKDLALTLDVTTNCGYETMLGFFKNVYVCCVSYMFCSMCVVYCMCCGYVVCVVCFCYDVHVSCKNEGDVHDD